MIGYVVGGGADETALFLAAGHEVTPDWREADIFCFTGGEDISPSLYGQKRLQCTGANPDRDTYEVDFYHKARGKYKIGLCRGGQLLNVLSGGSMWQHVTNHGLGFRGHNAVDTETGEIIRVSSVHHQMMIPAENGKVFMVASPSLADYRLNANEEIKHPLDNQDVEGVWYEHTKSLCFQPHPEWGPDSCTEYFIRQMKRFLKE